MKERIKQACHGYVIPRNLNQSAQLQRLAGCCKTVLKGNTIYINNIIALNKRSNQIVHVNANLTQGIDEMKRMSY